MTRRGEFRQRITNSFTLVNVQQIDDAFRTLTLNRYEGLAVQGLIEALRHLIARQQAMDECRRKFGVSKTGHEQPTPSQQQELFDLTKMYFESYYSAMGHVLSVVARFSGVFGQVTYTEITPFLKWLSKRSPYMSHGEFEELERARLFRAIIGHPQQFPAVDWATSVDVGTREHTYITLFGPESRKGVIPPGSTRSDPLAAAGDWVMNPPDELSVLNCVGSAVMFVAIEVLIARTVGSSFKPAESRRGDAIKLVLGPGGACQAPRPIPVPGVDSRQV